MSTKLFRIEIVITGFSHLIWMTLLSLLILQQSPYIILNFLSTIQSGSAIIITTLIICVSYFLGILAEHFGSSIIYFIGDEEKKRLIANSFKGKPDEVYANKIFFLSMSFAIPFISIFLLLNSNFDNCNRIWAIIINAISIEFGNVMSTFYWVKITRSLRS